MKTELNDNLKKALEMMLFMSDEQPDFNKINFKKEGWFKKYHWTARNEERYFKWLVEFLKNKWQGICDHKPIAKERNVVADSFIGNYGLTTRKLTTKDFTQLVPQGQLEEVMSSAEYMLFTKWMFGQTTSLHGVYRWDLEQYLNGGKSFD